MVAASAAEVVVQVVLLEYVPAGDLVTYWVTVLLPADVAGQEVVVMTSDTRPYPNVVAVVPNGECLYIPPDPNAKPAPYKPRPRERVPNGMPGGIGKTHR